VSLARSGLLRNARRSRPFLSERTNDNLFCYYKGGLAKAQSAVTFQPRRRITLSLVRPTGYELRPVTERITMDGSRYYGVRVEGAKYGVGFGSALAIAISYTNNHSILWAIVHGILGWLYVVYIALSG
jgi:hypothetical protein